KQLISQKEQELDRLVDRLERNITNQLQTNKHAFEQVDTKLKQHNPKQKVKSFQEKQLFLTQTLETSFQQIIDKKNFQFDKQLDKLHMLSPLNTMRRGYSIGYDENGQILKSVGKIKVGNQVKLKMLDGSLDCQVTGIEEDKHD